MAVASRATRPVRLRRAGSALVLAGVLLVAWSTVALVFGDPLTALYARHEQAALRRAFAAEVERFRAPARAAAHVRAQGHAPPPARVLAHDARRFAAALAPGQAFGRLRIPRISLDAVVVQGTDWWGDLRRGPGHYEASALPGLGRTAAVAGHRTTFGAWFRHIDEIRAGDPIVLQMPYATFRYRVQGHVISNNDDRRRLLAPQGYERLMLSACHPLYSASQRWVVFARAVSATLAGGAVVRFGG